eukprot:gene3137-13150_t
MMMKQWRTRSAGRPTSSPSRSVTSHDADSSKSRKVPMQGRGSNDFKVAATNDSEQAMDCSLEQDDDQTEIVRGSRIKYNDPAALPLRRRALWQPSEAGIATVLIIKKVRSPHATDKAREIGMWLKSQGIRVVVESKVHKENLPRFNALKQKPTMACVDFCILVHTILLSLNVLLQPSRFQVQKEELPMFDPLKEKPTMGCVDFCITLGGDGTVLHLASLFEKDEPMPPVLSFAMGTLGFLTPFDVNSFEHVLQEVLSAQERPLNCTLRTRKLCAVIKDGIPLAVRTVLNEVVIDRGAFPGAVILEVFVDGTYVTTVEADGLIIATPSGSTAYSMSAGGSLIAPSVPCTIITPIAPLSLSSRPIVIPESSSIVVHLPEYARSDARANFDGKMSLRMRRGTCIDIHTARYPLPVISQGMLDSDWYEGIVAKLHWNQVIKERPQMPQLKSFKEIPDWKSTMNGSMDSGSDADV